MMSYKTSFARLIMGPAFAMLLQPACIKLTSNSNPERDQSSILQGTSITDTDELSPLALTIRKSALEFVIKNMSRTAVNSGDPYALPTSGGKLPDVVKKTLLDFLEKQQGELVVKEGRPCFVDKQFLSPADVFEALQRAAVGRVSESPSFDDIRLPTPPPELRGVLWKKVLNYNPQTYWLYENLTLWFEDADFYNNSISPKVKVSLGTKKVTISHLLYKNYVFTSLKNNGIVLPEKYLQHFQNLSCLAASQIRGFSLPMYSEDIPDRLNELFPFENLSLIYGIYYRFPLTLLEPGGVLETKEMIRGLYIRGIEPAEFEASIRVNARQRIKQVIVGAEWLVLAGSGYLPRVFPNLETVEIIEDLIGDRGQEVSQIEKINALNRLLQELSLFGVKNLRIQTKFAKTLFPRLKPLHGIKSVVIESLTQGLRPRQPCLDIMRYLEGVDMVQLARIFPRAKNVWVRSARVFETKGAYPYLKDYKTDWEKVDFSECESNAKDTVLTLPSEIFPRLKSIKNHNCRLNIPNMFDFSRMAYDPLAAFKFAGDL